MTIQLILKQIRKVGNRTCADCSNPLIAQDTYCSQQHLVYICKTCAMVHNEHVRESNLVLALAPEALWDSATLHQIQLTCNASRNSILERWIPVGWSKPRPDSPIDDKSSWIKAKYVGHLFLWATFNNPALFAAPDAEPGGRSRSGSRNNHAGICDRGPSVSVQVGREQYTVPQAESLPTRLVDFFCIIGPQSPHADAPSTLPLPSACEDVPLIPVVQQSCPEAAYSDGTLLPPLIGDFVFPLGIRLSSEERPPQLMTFVLTDISRVKLFCTALIFHELVDPEDLTSLLGTEASSQFPVVYSPRAIAFLGHFGFFHAHALVLKELYRASLSGSPLPLERYVANFCLETPLPPRGRVEVVVSLPSKTLVLARAPSNRLPPVDFSFRPLFACLSLHHVLVAFKVLASEFSICFVSDNVSLLTPVQEALLSLLFPLVWQGCFIPVLPSSMIELLEAPVPFCVGVPRGAMPTRLDRHPLSVLIVDLDKDIITVGGKEVGDLCNVGSSPVVLEREEGPGGVGAYAGNGNGSHVSSSSPSSAPLSPSTVAELLEAVPEDSRELCRVLLEPFPRQVQKLTEKLREFGAGVYKGSNAYVQLQLSQSNLAFPQNEHLIPITEWTLDSGHAVAVAGATAGDGTSVGSGGGALGLAAKTSGGGHAGGALRRRSQAVASAATQSQTPICCSFVAAVAGRSARSSQLEEAADLFDPANNCSSDGSGKFDAREIRGAFLRFFVSLFLEIDENSASSTSPSQLSGSNRSNSVERYSIFSRMSTAIRGTDDKLSSQQQPQGEGEGLLQRVTTTQMYTNFSDERRFQPGLSEVRFFNESTIEKKNRSKITLSKALTPFLSDASEALRETYTTPAPSSLGLSCSSRFEYGRFPLLSPHLFGQVRPCRLLLQAPERVRAAALVDQGLSTRVVAAAPSKPKLGSVDVNLVIPVSNSWSLSAFLAANMVTGFGSISNNSRIIQNLSANGAATAADQGPVTQRSSASRIEAVLLQGALTHSRLQAACVRMQATMRRALCRRRFATARSAVVVIQCAERCRAARKASEQKQQLRAAQIHLATLMRVQRYVRFAVTRMRYRRLRRATLRLQAKFRGSVSRRWYRHWRRSLGLLGARVKGRTVRRNTMRELGQILDVFRRNLVLMWAVEGSSLLHRSLFLVHILAWDEGKGLSFAQVAAAGREFLRCSETLGISLSFFPRLQLPSLSTSGIASALAVPSTLDSLITSAAKILQSTAAAGPTPAQLDQLAALPSSQTMRTKASLIHGRLPCERRLLYAHLKTRILEGPRTALLERLGVPAVGKLKKERGLEKVWASLHWAEVQQRKDDRMAASKQQEQLQAAAAVIEINVAWLDGLASIPSRPGLSTAPRSLWGSSSGAASALAEADAEAAALTLLGLTQPRFLDTSSSFGTTLIGHWVSAKRQTVARHATLEVVNAALNKSMS